MKEVSAGKNTVDNLHNNDFDYDIELSKFVSGMQSLDNNDDRIRYMKSFAKTVANNVEYKDFEPSDCEDYQRNYLSRHSSGWEVMLICWEKGNKTKIHGHPEMCCYYYIEGDFELELFKLCDDNNIELEKSIRVGTGDTFADCGQPDTYCNHIHRVTCLSEKGYSINIYSDDACKGDEYDWEG